MYLKISELRLERKEISREKARIGSINTVLSQCNHVTERTQLLEQLRKDSGVKIEALESHSRKLWNKIETRLIAENIYKDDITAFQLRFYYLRDWGYIAKKYHISTDSIKKRLERISKSFVMIPDDEGVF